MNFLENKKPITKFLISVAIAWLVVNSTTNGQMQKENIHVISVDSA
jgi:hypothetical protein